MPIYEYTCQGCGNRFELLTSWSGADAQHCPECGEKAERLISVFASAGGCEATGGG